jgi:iron complex outermembrane recepter protein
MKKILPFLCYSFVVLVAHEEYLEPIEVQQSNFNAPLQSSMNALEMRDTYHSSSIERYSDPAQSSVFELLDRGASFHSEMIDPYGLSGVSGRSRGISSSFMSYNYNGVANYSIRPIGPRDGIYDLENVQRVEHYNGAISPQNSTGVGGKGGLVNIITQEPRNEGGGKISLSGGGDQYSKLFIRADSGIIAEQVKFFLSYSHTQAQKYKGEGDLGPRQNFALGVNLLNDTLPLTLLYSRNQHKRHRFKALSYEQTQDLSSNYTLDYSADSQSAEYYDFYSDDSLYEDLQLKLQKQYTHFGYSVTLYGSAYNEESKEGITGSGAGAGLQKGVVDAKRLGLLASSNYDFHFLELEGGFWQEYSWLDKYVSRVDEEQENLHKSWAWLNKNDGATKLFSPYLLMKKKSEALSVELGLRYLDYREAANTTYLPNNSYKDYDEAIANGVVAPGGRVEAQHYKVWLPSFGVSYNFQPESSVYFKYAKGYQRPYRYSFAAQYGADAKGIRTKLLAQGKTLADIVDSWDIERSDLFDMGWSYHYENGDLKLNTFYNLHENLLSLMYDPLVDSSYIQNSGKAEVYGLELQNNYEASENFWFLLSAALSDSKVLYSELRGNKIPETPKLTLKSSIGYSFARFHTAHLKAKYIGSRYADISNKQKVKAYSVYDLSYEYQQPDLFSMKNFRFFATVQNILNEKYIASIGSADLLEDKASFFVAPPRTLIFGVRGVF